METFSGQLILVPTPIPVPTVGPGQTVVGRSLMNGGLDVLAGGTVFGTVLSGGGLLTIEAGGVGLGTAINSGGNEGVNGRETGVVVNAGGSLSVGAGAVDGAVINGGGFLSVQPGGVATNTNLQPGGRADFAGIAYSPLAVAVLDAATDVLTISGGGTAASIQLAGSYAGDTFKLSSDGPLPQYAPGGTVISLSGPANAPDAPRLGNVITVNAGSVTTNAGVVDTVTLGPGLCTVASNGTDTIFGGAGGDTISAAGNDLVVGGAGAMTFNGGAGHSVVFAGQGGLSYNGGAGSDIVVGLAGNPILVNGGRGLGAVFRHGRQQHRGRDRGAVGAGGVEWRPAVLGGVGGRPVRRRADGGRLHVGGAEHGK